MTSHLYRRGLRFPTHGLLLVGVLSALCSACSDSGRRSSGPSGGGSTGGEGQGEDVGVEDTGLDSGGIRYVRDGGIVLEDCEDDDRDGYGVGPGCRGADLDDTDGRVYPGAPEHCDGVDNDGNDLTDAEDLNNFVPEDCAFTEGVCRGTKAECRDGESFPCDPAVYGEDYIENEDRHCDRRDNDCDGVVDEGCDCVDGEFEICPDDACADRECADGRWLSCLRTRQPEAETCDGIDNDCDGDTDEPDDPLRPRLCGRCPFEMMLVDTNNLDVCIDRWEASRVDSRSDHPGMREDVSSSRPAVMPWMTVDRATARSACRAAGKELCNVGQWVRACIYVGYEDINPDWKYPYGESYKSGRCNDRAAGNGRVLATGSMPECVVDKERAAYDLSGNVREWIEERVEGQRAAFGGSYDSDGVDLSCESRALLSGSTQDLETGFRCCIGLQNN